MKKEKDELTKKQKKISVDSLGSILASENRCCTIQFWKDESPLDYFQRTGKEYPDEEIFIWGDNEGTDNVIKFLLTLYQ